MEIGEEAAIEPGKTGRPRTVISISSGSHSAPVEADVVRRFVALSLVTVAWGHHLMA